MLKIVFRLYLSAILSDYRKILSDEAELHSETDTRPKWKISKIQVFQDCCHFEKIHSVVQFDTENCHVSIFF